MPHTTRKKGVTGRMLGGATTGHPNAPTEQKNHPKGPAHATRD